MVLEERKKPMAYTSGPLNKLNGKMGISAANKSVPVMKLIRVHNPKSKDELVQLITYHSKNECKCGIKSQGTIENFGRNLYNAQMKYWGEYRYSLRDCIQWEYDLFILQSIKGNLIEKKIISNLILKLPGYTIVESEGYLDEELRIDIIIKKRGKVKCGIQVKPFTFYKMRSEVILFSKSVNKKWSNPVFYLYYDNNEKFRNLNKVIEKIKLLE